MGMGLGDLLDRSRDAIVAAAEAAGIDVAGPGFMDFGTGDGQVEVFDDGFEIVDAAGNVFSGMHVDQADQYLDLEPKSYYQGLVRGFGAFGLRVHDMRKMLLWLAILAVVLFIAVVTNPTETSFRTYLTELSFRRHLAVIRSNDDSSSADTPTAPASSASVEPTANGHAPAAHDKEPAAHAPSLTVTGPGTASGTDTPPIAPFRFSNHVAISLRTPTLYYKTLFFLSLAITSPIGPPAFLADPIQHHVGGKKPALARERLVLYLGYFGHWVQIGVIPRQVETVWRYLTESTKEKGRKKNAADRSGVLELRAMPGKEDAAAATGSAKVAIPLNPTKAIKMLRKSGSNADLHEAISSPVHATPNLPVSALAESRRPSTVSLLQPPVAAEPAAADTPTLIALKSDLSKAQDALLDLKNQLLSHEQTVSDSHASLQATLDDLRNKRKEDDVERQELKGRTKSLEEQKRQAESARKEAEKKLKAAEGLRDALLGRIESAKKEMRDIKCQIEASAKAVRVLTEEGARYVVETREEVEGRRGELEILEGHVQGLEHEHEELGGRVKEAEERLKATHEQVEAARKMGPEEEMMMMAAAYEAAAQEGYSMYGQGQGNGPGHNHGHNQHLGHGHGLPPPHLANGPGGHHNHSTNWATQAAAYMAEAGMPLLDQSYTARPTQANHFSNRIATDSSKRLTADLAGFEDFGPGANPSSKRYSDEAFGQILGNAASRLQPSTPPAGDDASESDIYGLDPGSPNGGISTSFSANLLPQGLFRSLLGGDATPVDDGTGSTLEEALNFDPPPIQLSPDPHHVHLHTQAHGHGHGHGHDSGSDSGDETEDIWRSPMLDLSHSPNVVNNHLNGPSEADPIHKPAARDKRFSFSRLLPPSTTPPGSATLQPPVLSGLPALPGARRWFSGTGPPGSTHSASTENLHAFPLFHPTGSTDSLGHPGSLGLGGDSPFAPSEKEKKQLALKWGPLSKYRWSASPRDAGGAGAGAGAVGDDMGPTGAGVTRSASLDLNHHASPHSRGTSAPVGMALPHPSPELPSPGQGQGQGQSWMARHLHVNGTPTSASKTKPTNKSPLIPQLSPRHRLSSDLLEEDELDYRSLAAPSQTLLGTSADSGGSGASGSKDDSAKKGFKFFSLRKSGSSIWNSNSGSSPGSL